jgi:hypothetical protein
LREGTQSPPAGATVARGDAVFTVPLFDEFQRRSMPGAEWRE